MIFNNVEIMSYFRSFIEHITNTYQIFPVGYFKNDFFEFEVKPEINFKDNLFCMIKFGSKISTIKFMTNLDNQTLLKYAEKMTTDDLKIQCSKLFTKTSEPLIEREMMFLLITISFVYGSNMTYFACFHHTIRNKLNEAVNKHTPEKFLKQYQNFLKYGKDIFALELPAKRIIDLAVIINMYYICPPGRLPVFTDTVTHLLCQYDSCFATQQNNSLITSLAFTVEKTQHPFDFIKSYPLVEKPPTNFLERFLIGDKKYVKDVDKPYVSFIDGHEIIFSDRFLGNCRIPDKLEHVKMLPILNNALNLYTIKTPYLCLNAFNWKKYEAMVEKTIPTFRNKLMLFYPSLYPIDTQGFSPLVTNTNVAYYTFDICGDQGKMSQMSKHILFDDLSAAHEYASMLSYSDWMIIAEVTFCNPVSCDSLESHPHLWKRGEFDLATKEITCENTGKKFTVYYLKNDQLYFKYIIKYKSND